MARYRDSKTGRFVSAATWKRSKAHGGTRYKRERPSAPPAKKKKKKKKRAQSVELNEYVLHFDYGRKRKRNLIRFQVHMFAPRGLSDRDVIAGIRQWDGGKLPEGWKVETITWGRPGRRAENETDSRTDSVQPSALKHGRATVRRKNSV